MPKLPSAEQLGFNDPRASYSPPTYPTDDPVAQAEIKRGAALQSLGQTGAAIGIKVMDDQQTKASALQEAQANAYYQSGKIQNDNALDDETDPDKAASYVDNHRTLLDQSASIITDPQKRELWKLKNTPSIATTQGSASDKAFSLQQDAALASSFTQLQTLQQTAATAKSDADREGAIKSGHNLIDQLEENGYITSEDAAKRRTQWANGYAVSAFQQLPAAQRLETLGAGSPSVSAAISGAADKYGIPADTLNKFAHIESRFNPNADNGTAKGLFQFVPSTWKQYGNGGDVFDPNANADAAARLYVDNANSLKASLGRDPTPGEVYLAHQQGAGGAAKLLKNPDANASSIVGKSAVTMNGGTLGMSAGQFAQLWVGKFDDGGGPAQAKPGSNLLPFMTPDQRLVLRSQAEREVTAQDRQSQQANRAEVSNVKSLMKDDEDSIAATGQPVADLTPDRVTNALGPEVGQSFAANRQRAQRYYDQTNDLDTIPSDEIAQRVESLKPQGGNAGFREDAAWYNTAQDKADKILKLRRTDPAAAVDRLPDVQAAKANASLDQPETYQAVAKARMAAQDRLGIPEDLRSPITREEAQQLWKPISNAGPSDQKDVLSDTVKQIDAAFGDQADGVMQSVLREGHANVDVRKATAAVLRKLARDEMPTPEDARAVDDAHKTAASTAAVSSLPLMPPTDPNGVPLSQLDAYYNPAPSRPQFPTPDPDAIRMLQSDPRLAGKFDQAYGAGSSKKVLDLVHASASAR